MKKLNFYVLNFFVIGWYRDCNIIPHTTDADLAMWSHEYDSKSFEVFHSNISAARVIAKLGLIKEGLEFRIFTTRDLVVDIFLTYKVNDTYQSNGYHPDRRLYKQLLVNFNESNLCSAELLEAKYIVPCNPEAYLSFQYGENNWKKPLLENYFDSGSIGYFKNWADQEWPYAVRYYDFISGKLRDNATLEYINKFADNKLKVLPDDLF
jgi:hypothetical protein